MELCTNLQNRVIDLEKTKTSQAQEITSLKRRVKRLEKKGGLRTHKLKRLYKVGRSARVISFDEEGLGKEDASKQGRIADIDADAGINLVSTHFDADTNMFGVHDLVGDEVVVEREVVVKAASIIPVSAATTTTTVITDDEITLAKALAELKNPSPKAKGLVIHEQEQAPTLTVSSQQPSQLNVQDKGKGKMVELEPVKKLSKKDQLMLDEELAFKLQAELEEDYRLVRQREKESNIVSWDNVVNIFVDIDTELVEGSEVRAKAKIAQKSSLKRVDTELEQESIKKQKIHKEVKKTYYQIIRADGSSKMYLVFSHMLKSFDKEDLETLWKLVKAKHGSTRPEEGYERVL
ncbi:hypothetical protein Tco_0070744 [Tanacetum coccineum]